MIEIEYKCSMCMKEHEIGQVWIKPRMDGESTEAFMHRVQLALSDAHSEHKPFCRNRTAANVRIPIDNNGVLGRNP